jgi:hypothetical protein
MSNRPSNKVGTGGQCDSVFLEINFVVPSIFLLFCISSYNTSIRNNIKPS